MNDRVKKLIDIGYNNNLMCYDSEALSGQITDKLLLVMHENAKFVIEQIYIATTEQKEYYTGVLTGTFPNQDFVKYKLLLIATNKEEDKAILGAC